MSLEYEPSSEPLHNSAKQLFLDREQSDTCTQTLVKVAATVLSLQPYSPI